jgi:hypothetical protein
LLAFAAPRCRAQSQSAPDAGAIGGGSGNPIQQMVSATGCQPWQLGVIQRAAAIATGRATRARNQLGGADGLIFSVFRAHVNPDSAGNIVSGITDAANEVNRSLIALFNRLPSVNTSSFACSAGTPGGSSPDSDCEEGGQHRQGYAVPGSLPIHFCPEFFVGASRQDEDQRVQGIFMDGMGSHIDPPPLTDMVKEEGRIRTVIHEAAHVAGIGTPHSECRFLFFVCNDDGGRGDQCVGGPPRHQWADAWSLLVTCLTTNGDPGGQDCHNAAGCQAPRPAP